MGRRVGTVNLTASVLRSRRGWRWGCLFVGRVREDFVLFCWWGWGGCGFNHFLSGGFDKKRVLYKIIPTLKGS